MQFDLRTMAEHMGGVAWAVVIVLFIMSMYSIAVMIERYWTFKKATDTIEIDGNRRVRTQTKNGKQCQ